MQTHITYIEAISELFPDCFCSCQGDGADYASLVYESGAPIPEKGILDSLVLSLTRTKAWLNIQAERERRKFSGLKIGNYWFHTDDSSRIQYLGLFLAGANIPAGVMWKTMTKEFVEMTHPLAVSIFQGMIMQDIAIFARAEEHKAAMEASATPGTYDYMATNTAVIWPEAFTDAFPGTDITI